jgi:glutathione S-transferase
MDGDFKLTESVAIIRYLAAKVESAAYPKDAQTRARIDEAIDWFNVNFYRDWGYGLVYPQIFPHHKRPTDALQAGTLAWAVERSRIWLAILNDHMLGPDRAYLCGDRLTLADYVGCAILTIGELLHCDLSPNANIERWLSNKKAGPNYAKVYEVFNGFVASTKGGAFTKI